ncbi:hypothetical protein Gohar_013891, partial [Gossypium harknessii]|nr:hypothetical protein [Gossypium harknessii]
MNITGMSEQWVAAQTKQKGDGKCIPWNSLLDKRVMPVPAILVETFRSLNAYRR